MMAAQSATWSYLKRAWNNDFTFERASRSLAKTGLCFRSLGGLCRFFFGCVFLGCFFGAQRVPKGSPKGSKIDDKEVSKSYLKKVPQKVPKMMQLVELALIIMQEQLRLQRLLLVTLMQG